MEKICSWFFSLDHLFGIHKDEIALTESRTKKSTHRKKFITWTFFYSSLIRLTNSRPLLFFLYQMQTHRHRQ